MTRCLRISHQGRFLGPLMRIGLTKDKDFRMHPQIKAGPDARHNENFG